MFNRKSMDHSWIKVDILVASRADFYFNAVITWGLLTEHS